MNTFAPVESEKSSIEEVAAVVASARRAVPTWSWDQVGGDRRLRRSPKARGLIELGDLSFRVDFYSPGTGGRGGDDWTIHWGPAGLTAGILMDHARLHGGAGLFRKIVVCMRDMIGDFLVKGHPDGLTMSAASRKHGQLYAEILSAASGTDYGFDPARRHGDEEDVVAIRFARDARCRRLAFDASTFTIGERRTPSEFEAAPAPASTFPG